MSLKHFLLGLVRDTGRTGYDLHKYFNRVGSEYWGAEQRQVYHALTNMEDAGWLTSEIVLQEGSPNRRVYYITEAGLEELIRWVKTPLPSQPARFDWLGQFAFGNLVAPEDLMALLDAQAEQAEHALARVTKHRESVFNAVHHPEGKADPRIATLRLLTMMYGVMRNQMRLEWIAYARGIVEAYGDPATDLIELADQLAQDMDELDNTTSSDT